MTFNETDFGYVHKANGKLPNDNVLEVPVTVEPEGENESQLQKT